MLVTKATAAIQPGADDSASDTGSFDIILSAQTRDRDGDVFKASEWKTPLPEWIPIDVDHAMSVEKTVGSGRPYINDDGDLQVTGTYASTPLAQQTRTLVNEGHVRYVSVAVMTDKSLKDGSPNRELLNGAFVNTPSNREAVILASKGLALGEEIEVKADDSKKPYGDVAYADPGYQKDGQHRYPLDTAAHVRSAWSYVNMPKNSSLYTAAQLAKVKDKIKAAAEKFGIEISDDTKATEADDATMKAGARNSGADSKMIQAIHDASSLLGAECASEAAPDAGSGADEGANKSAWRAMIVGKALAGSVEDLRDRLSDAVQDVAGDDCWIWVRATFLDAGGNSGTVVYDLGEETYSRTFTDEDGLITLGGTLECVTFVTSVAPAPAQVDDDPSDTVEGSADEHDEEDDDAEMRGLDRSAFLAQLDAITKTSGQKAGSPDSPAAPAEPPADAAPSGPADAAGDAADMAAEEMAQKTAAEMLAGLFSAQVTLSTLEH
jgi:hypothetical protein